MKKILSWIGLIISSIIIFLLIFLDIKQFLSLGYIIERNSITGKLDLFAHIVMILFFMFFLLATKKNK